MPARCRILYFLNIMQIAFTLLTWETAAVHSGGKEEDGKAHCVSEFKQLCWILLYTVSLSKSDAHLENVTFADTRQKEAFSWHTPSDPESTMGVLSEMLFQMKKNVINNPLVEDVSALQSGSKQQMSCNGTIRVGRTYWRWNKLHARCFCSNRFDLGWSHSGEIFIKHQIHFFLPPKCLFLYADKISLLKLPADLSPWLVDWLITFIKDLNKLIESKTKTKK